MKSLATYLGLLLAWLSVAAVAEPLSVYTVNYPLAYFAERIAGEQAEVVFPAPAGRDPAFGNQQSLPLASISRPI
ncbi:MAG: hypothetical protein HC808_06995 [Candidatus Competibacteraceae bacterium]|nr:hypothetical protein [Candidatus Competibacteraceae bacterium]